jgi:hypothetical protein
MLQTTRAVTLAWVGLVALTALSFAAAESPEIGGTVITLTVIGSAAFKAALVLHRFMGAGSFPRPWQVFFGAWVVGNALMVFGFRLAS